MYQICLKPSFEIHKKDIMEIVMIILYLLQKMEKLCSFKCWKTKSATHNLFPLQTMDNVHESLKAEFGP